MRKVLGSIRKVDYKFNMINKGDKILIGVSGGKDSLLLVYALKLYQKFCPNKFDIESLIVDGGFKNVSYKKLYEFHEKLNVKLHLIKAKISAEYYIKQKKLTSPCSYCARVRRGILSVKANELNCNKIALGHHLDDAINTFFMSLFYEGRFNTFTPKTYMSRKNVTVIRPFVYLNEEKIKAVVEKLELPVMKSPCPFSGKTKREYIDGLVDGIESAIPHLNERMKKAFENKEQLSLWFD